MVDQGPMMPPESPGIALLQIGDTRRLRSEVPLFDALLQRCHDINVNRKRKRPADGSMMLTTDQVSQFSWLGILGSDGILAPNQYTVSPDQAQLIQVYKWLVLLHLCVRDRLTVLSRRTKRQCSDAQQTRLYQDIYYSNTLPGHLLVCLDVLNPGAYHASAGVDSLDCCDVQQTNRTASKGWTSAAHASSYPALQHRTHMLARC